ncbi:hypothetical protein TrispH2_006417 [Trichoplax sp. H2]|nr:hypothetical protein TrispH2_006417 [Trichoplax sp. H2]|eukprot:RDD41529.1 hypothetical protein TrispH2_006417 [Trichoplax sp. H2]
MPSVDVTRRVGDLERMMTGGRFREDDGHDYERRDMQRASISNHHRPSIQLGYTSIDSLFVDRWMRMLIPSVDVTRRAGDLERMMVMTMNEGICKEHRSATINPTRIYFNRQSIRRSMDENAHLYPRRVMDGLFGVDILDRRVRNNCANLLDNQINVVPIDAKHSLQGKASSSIEPYGSSGRRYVTGNWQKNDSVVWIEASHS